MRLAAPSPYFTLHFVRRQVSYHDSINYNSSSAVDHEVFEPTYSSTHTRSHTGTNERFREAFTHPCRKLIQLIAQQCSAKKGVRLQTAIFRRRECILLHRSPPRAGVSADNINARSLPPTGTHVFLQLSSRKSHTDTRCHKEQVIR